MSAWRDAMSSRGAARRRSRSTSSALQKHRERRAARRHLLEVALVERLRRLLDEPRDELVVVLRGDLAVLLAHAKERRGVALEPLRAAALVERVEELVEEASAPQAVAQALLVLRTHEEHLVDEELRVVRVVPATEAEEQIDLVDAREVARIRAAVLLTTHAVRLVVGPNAVEEAVDVELGEEHVVERPDVLERVARASSKSVSATACEIPIGAMRISASAARM